MRVAAAYDTVGTRAPGLVRRFILDDSRNEFVRLLGYSSAIYPFICLFLYTLRCRVVQRGHVVLRVLLLQRDHRVHRVLLLLGDPRPTAVGALRQQVEHGTLLDGRRQRHQTGQQQESRRRILQVLVTLFRGRNLRANRPLICARRSW